MTPPAPPLWTTLSELWRLDPGEATRCWRALYQARWSVSASLRQRPPRLELTSAQVAVLAAMDPTTRLNEYRKLQAEQQKG